MINTEIRLLVLFAAKDGEALYSQQKQGRKLTVAQDHELLIDKFRLKLKKVRKTNCLICVLTTLQAATNILYCNHLVCVFHTRLRGQENV